jgi:D-citramalate synthase
MFYTNSRIHADGDNKNNLYFNDLLPERFGEKTICIGKTSGKANEKNLQELGLKLNQKI